LAALLAAAATRRPAKAIATTVGMAIKAISRHGTRQFRSASREPFRSRGPFAGSASQGAGSGMAGLAGLSTLISRPRYLDTVSRNGRKPSPR
jgi:hypothetical protein